MVLEFWGTKSDREGKIPYNLIYMWSLKNQIKPTNQPSKQKITEDGLVVAKEGWVGARQMGEGSKGTNFQI